MIEDELYAKAQAVRGQDPRAAVAVLEELIVRRPEYPNALNLAGWLLLQLGDPLSVLHGVRLLRRAVELFPDEAMPLANLVEALVQVDRADEALVVVEAAIANRPFFVEALNTSGWLKTMKLGRVDEGIADLQRAIRSSSWDGNANFNLGRALRLKGDAEGALAAFRTSLIRGSFRDHEAHLRIAEGHETAGRLRRALGAYRQAARLDARGELTAELHAAINRVGNALLQRGRFFLHGDDEHRRFDYLRGNSAACLPTVRASAIAAAAKRLPSSPGVELIVANMTAQALLPAYSDQSPGTEPLVKALLDDYFAAWIRLYEVLLDAEEPESQGPKTTVLQLTHARKFSEVSALLEAWEGGSEDGILTRAAFGELAGDLAWLHGEKSAARQLYALSEDAYAGYASGASAGGEGMARMVDVNRLRGKLKPAD